MARELLARRMAARDRRRRLSPDRRTRGAQLGLVAPARDDMHRPEEWGYVQFSTARTGTEPFQPDPTWPASVWLHRVYYAQRDYRAMHGRWADRLSDLNVPRSDLPGLSGFDLKVAGDLYEATVNRLHIRQDSLVWAEVDSRDLKFVKPALRAEESDSARR